MPPAARQASHYPGRRALALPLLADGRALLLVCGMTDERISRKPKFLNARITATYIVRDVCAPQDLVDTGMTFEEMVRDLIESERLTGLADQEQIVSVEEIP